MTDPRVDPHGATPGTPFSPSGSPAGAPAAGSGTSGWPGRSSAARRAPSDPPPTTPASPRTTATDRSAPVTGTFEPPDRPTAPPPRSTPPPRNGAAPSSAAYPAQSASPPRRRPSGSRKARLRLTRIDPWSALKTSLVFSGFLFIVWMVAVIVLFLVLTVAGTFDSINSTLSDVLGTHVDFNGGVIIGIALVVGALSVVLVSALGTVIAFAYNVTASLIGGVDVTLTESEQ